MGIATAKVKQIVFWNDNTLGKPVIVLISGKMKVGKTTTAMIMNSILFESGFTGSVESIAKFVKESALSCFDWDSTKDNKGRKLLQDIGRTGRAYDESIWIRKLFDYLDSNYIFLPDFLLIDDWRYKNEFEWIKDRLYTVITLNVVSSIRGESSDDESEHNLDDFSGYDYVIQNDSKSLEDYYKELVKFISQNILKKEN